MNISMILIGGGVVLGALAFLPKGEDEKAEGREVVRGMITEGAEQAEVFDPDTGYYFELDAPEYIPPTFTPDFGATPEFVPFPVAMGDPERQITISGNVHISVEVR